MKRLYTKLIALTLSLMLSISVVVASSYAWLSLSDSPTVDGIKITVGGGNTILVAADVVTEVDGVTYHYPSGFSDSLNFSYYSTYNYLSDLGGLTPVSTSDGLSWYMPDYYDGTDEEVLAGNIATGTLKDITEFDADNYLAHANLSAQEKEAVSEGSYVYLDFWVVSPGADYELRISTGDDSSGSFLVGAMAAKENADGSFTLDNSGDDVAACARVGFLVNPDLITDKTMEYYQKTSGFSEQYTRLKGAYTEKGSGNRVFSNSYRFTIYEPNGDYHPALGEGMNGTYLVTEPLGLTDGQIALQDIRDRVSVQLTSSWKKATESQTLLEQIFQTAIAGRSGMTVPELNTYFYRDYLQWQVSPYVQKSPFVRNTSSLYSYADQLGTGMVDATYFAQNVTAGATDDVVIVELERNVPQRIRMFIWLEGQDVDCVNSVAASAFILNLELAGGN